MGTLAEAWEMGNEANLFLLHHLPKECLACRYSPRTRTVAAQFAHMHNVRLRWLQHAAPKLEPSVPSFPRGAQPGQRDLKSALKDSARTMARFLDDCETAGRVRSWKGAPTTFLGYLLAHEAHHRGLAMAAIRLSGHKLPKEVVYGQWDWGKRHSMR